MDMPRVSHTVEHFIHAYAQAPWRTQRQRIGALLLAAVGLAMVAALYLDVTSQAAITGRQIQELTSETITIQHDSAALESKLAELTSTKAMEDRAQAEGYEAIDPSKLQYVVVPGYTEPKPDILAGAMALTPSAPSLEPEYTESLIAWLRQRLGAMSSPTSGLAGVSQ
jgi:hypothetical protein